MPIFVLLLIEKLKIVVAEFAVLEESELYVERCIPSPAFGFGQHS